MTEVGAKITNQYKSVSTGQFLMDHTDDGHDASTDLFWGVTMIIRAYPQRHHLYKNTKYHIYTYSILIQEGLLHLLCYFLFKMTKYCPFLSCPNTNKGYCLHVHSLSGLSCIQLILQCGTKPFSVNVRGFQFISCLRKITRRITVQ